MDLLVAVIIFWLGIGICKDDSAGKVLYRRTLGRPATLGMLYSAHSDNFIPGFGFWEENEIKENKQIVCHGSAKTTLAYDQTQDQKRFLLDVKAELEISVKANIPVEVWGSAGYLKHEEDLSSTATVTLLYESITKTEAISTYLTNKLANSDQTAQACNWKEDGDVPTHVVSSVTYGGDAIIQFERFIQDIDDSEEIHGALRIAIDLEAFSIAGSASVDHEDKKISNLTDTKIFTFTDFIIPEQPTSLEDTIKLYKEISTHLGTKEDNFASSVPMSVTLIPLKRFCPETSQLAEEIASHVMKIATDIRLELLDTDKKIAKLLSKRVAMENFRVKQLLLDFQEELSNYTLSYEKNLQKMIVEARNPLKKTGENDLAELVISYKNSDFNFPIFLFGYLTQREREINAIDILYLETVKKKEPQIAAYKAAKIPFALITGRRVFVVTLKVLPNFEEEKYRSYLEYKKKGIFGEKSGKKWYNDFKLVGAIGKLWTAYKTFFEYNSYKVGDSFHVNLLQAESDNLDMIATLRLYVYGEEQEGFKIPVQPEKPSVCRKEQNRKIVVKVKNPPELHGPSVIKSILVEIALAKSHIRKKSQNKSRWNKNKKLIKKWKTTKKNGRRTNQPKST